MNTKTMRLPPRRVLTQPNKRKEREGIDGVKQPSKTAKLAKPTTFQSGSKDPASSSNQLLAGYLAHEFLTQGTLFGQPWDPARAEVIPLVVSSTLDLRKGKPTQTQTQTQIAEAEPEPTTRSGRKAEPPQLENYQRYVELANLLKTDGAHLAGIVNPTQLARLLQM